MLLWPSLPKRKSWFRDSAWEVAFISGERHKVVYNGLTEELQPLAPPKVLVLYRKRADETSRRSGRNAARRAFDTAT